MADSDSIFYHYQRIIRLRKEIDIITDGDFELISKEDESVFAYVRSNQNEKLLVINNFYRKDTIFTLPKNINIDGLSNSVLISNYEDSAPLSKELKLRPYESVVYYLKK